MPTYTFYSYALSALSFNSSTGEFEFSASYDPATDRIRFDVTDDDAVMNVAGDTNQLANVYDGSGTLIDSGEIYVPAYAAVTNPAGGGTIFLDRIEVDGVHYGYVSNVALTPGTNYPVSSSDTVEENHTYYETNSTPCFGPDTIVETIGGPRVISSLSLGDLVLTYDSGPQPIVWLGQMPVSAMQLLTGPNTRPTRFNGGISGIDDPVQPLTLSRQHRVLIEGAPVSLAAGTDQAFIPAGWLTTPYLPRQGIVWHHILLPQHEVIRANGVWVESLFAGGALDDLISPNQLKDVQQALGHSPHQSTARPCLRRPEADVVLQSSWWSQTRNKRVARGEQAA